MYIDKEGMEQLIQIKIYIALSWLWNHYKGKSMCSL